MGDTAPAQSVSASLRIGGDETLTMAGLCGE